MPQPEDLSRPPRNDQEREERARRQAEIDEYKIDPDESEDAYHDSNGGTGIR